MRMLGLIGALFLGDGAASAEGKPPPPWVRHEVGGAFSVELPAYVKRKPVRGIDSLVAEFRGSRLVVQFDYGIYGARADCQSAKDCDVSPTTIDGRTGLLEVRRWGHGEKIRLRFHANVVVRAPPGPRLPAVTLAATVNCWGAPACERAPQILSRIRFAASDPTPR